MHIRRCNEKIGQELRAKKKSAQNVSEQIINANNVKQIVVCKLKAWLNPPWICILHVGRSDRSWPCDYTGD